MQTKNASRFFLLLALVGLLVVELPLLGRAAAVSDDDSTQPRGAPLEDARNAGGQLLDPIIDGFRAPAFRASLQEDSYTDWAGTMMANATRDPAFFATLSIANRDIIEFANSLPGDPKDSTTPLGAFLKRNQIAEDISRGPDGRLQPEDLLPVAADICLRCHTPPGWMEAHSEPPSKRFPFLAGQFWGAAFRQHPVDANGKPRIVDTSRESEAEMDGIDCDFCHRVTDASRRPSRFDGSSMAAGNGGFFVDRNDPFEEEVEPEYDILGEGDFCGACHDVTNPLIKTATKIGGVVPDMLHPIERTYTEWYWSGFRGEQSCQDCHEPMQFQGAQTWMVHPVLASLWGEVDRPWREAPYDYAVPERAPLYQDAAKRNRAFLGSQAADVEILEIPGSPKAGDAVALKVKVTNKTGHKLPTGFSEGRQAWIHVKAVDEAGVVLFEDGALDGNGFLVRTPETKVYEQVVLAGRPELREKEGRTCYAGYPFLDENADGCVDEHESHFHFVLMNYIKKDNRIPPKGYNKAAYTKDGAFIVPFDPKDTDYADGQNWDVTPYGFGIPPDAKGRVRITATLWYQTFSRQYVEFLHENDIEKTLKHGGRARNLPPGPFDNHETWGSALYQLWKDAGMGPPVRMGQAEVMIPPDSAGPDRGAKEEKRAVTP
jgi:hypothetical protein